MAIKIRLTRMGSKKKPTYRIIAVNSDKDAPIFKLAHVCIVSDLYEVLPQMISKLKEKEA